MFALTRHANMLIMEPQVPLTLPNAVNLLLHAQNHMRKAGVRYLVLNLEHVAEIDGAGVGVIVKATTEALAAGQRLFLYRPSPAAVEALQHSQVSGFFPLLEYEEDLLARMAD
jgi:anti-sigma B factor antagonist